MPTSLQPSSYKLTFLQDKADSIITYIMNSDLQNGRSVKGWMVCFRHDSVFMNIIVASSLYLLQILQVLRMRRRISGNGWQLLLLLLGLGFAWQITIIV